MRNRRLRLVCLVLALICCMTLFPGAALAAVDIEESPKPEAGEMVPNRDYVNQNSGFVVQVFDLAGYWSEAEQDAVLEQFRPLSAYMDVFVVCADGWSEEDGERVLAERGQQDAMLYALDPQGTLFFDRVGLLEERFTEDELHTLLVNTARRFFRDWKAKTRPFGEDFVQDLLKALDGDKLVLGVDDEPLLFTLSDGSQAYSIRSAEQLYQLEKQKKLDDYPIYVSSGEDLVLDRNLTVPTGAYLGLWNGRVIIPAGVTLSVEKGAELYISDLSLEGYLVNRGHVGQPGSDSQNELGLWDIQGEIRNSGELQVDNMLVGGSVINNAGGTLYHFSVYSAGTWKIEGSIQNAGEIRIDPEQYSDGSKIEQSETGYCKNREGKVYDPATGEALKPVSSVTSGSQVSVTTTKPKLPNGGLEYSNPDTGFRAVVIDELGLMTSAEQEQLLEDMKAITKYGNAAFWSTDTYTSQEVEQARLKRRELFGLTSGTIFVVNMGVRKISLQNYGYIESLLPSSYANTITNNVRNYATRKDYYGCASRAFSQVLTLMEGNRIAQPMKYMSNASIALMLGLMIMLLQVFRHASSFTRPNVRTLIAASAAGALSVFALNAVVTGSERKYSPPSSSSGSSCSSCSSGGSSCSSCSSGGSSCSSCGSGGSSSF